MGVSMNGTETLIWLFGGIALILWSVRMIRTGMNRALGNRLHAIVGNASSNRIRSYFGGLLVTCALQSSTATSLIVASLARQRVIATASGLAIMLGADVGTTLAAQLLSFKVHWLAPLFMLFGYGVFSRNENSALRHAGRILIGLGLLMLALRLIMEATEPLRSNPVMLEVITAMSSDPLLCLTVAAMLTWLAHSSLATVLLVMSMASSGLIPLQPAMILVLGANLGGVIAPIVASASYEPAGRRVPAANALVRVIGVLACLPLIGFASQYVALSSTDIARQLVNFHTAFNVLLSLLALPWCGTVAGILQKLIPDQKEEASAGTPMFLDERTLETPDVAITVATREARRMADILSVMLHQTMLAIRVEDPGMIQHIRQTDNTVDQLYDRIKLFVTRIAGTELDHEQSTRAMEIVTFVTNLEHIGDIIDKSLMDLAEKRLKQGISFSEDGIREIESLHAEICGSLDLAISIFNTGDVSLAKQLIARKQDMQQRERNSYDAHLIRLASGTPNTVKSSSLHVDIIRDLRRIHSHLVAIAHSVIDENRTFPSVAKSRVAHEAAGNSDSTDETCLSLLGGQPAANPQT